MLKGVVYLHIPKGYLPIIWKAISSKSITTAKMENWSLNKTRIPWRYPGDPRTGTEYTKAQNNFYHKSQYYSKITRS